MEEAIVRRLVELNSAFYKSLATPFVASRSHDQPGYSRLLEYIPQSPIDVLDVGCGNGRFGRFLLGHRTLASYTGVDFSREMVTETSGFPGRFIIRDLSQPDCLAGLMKYPIIVSLATLQHIPGRVNRVRLLADMTDHLAANGKIILSCWQFLSNDRQRRKLRPWSDIDIGPQDVELGDYLLSWQRGGRGLRYVAYIDINEIEVLANLANLRIVSQFVDDGREGNLNLYTVLAG